MARAPALHAGGHRFESVILHKTNREIIDMVEARKTQISSKAKQRHQRRKTGSERTGEL